MTGATDERRHAPGDDPLWNESWYFDFSTPDGGVGGYVRLGLYPNLGVAWYWAAFVRPEEPPLVVRHHQVVLPAGPGLELREDGLWSALHCETPMEHWTVGLEAFALALDDPRDAHDAEPRGDRVPLGFDLEWESTAPQFDYPGVSRYEQSCRVSGEVLVGTEALEIDGFGQRDHSWGVRDWWTLGWVWTAGRFADGVAFHAMHLDHESISYGPGYVVTSADLTALDGFAADVSDGTKGLPGSTEMALGSLTMTAHPTAFASVRLDSPDGRTGVLHRSLCRFDRPDGVVGYGWTEWNRPRRDQ